MEIKKEKDIKEKKRGSINWFHVKSITNVKARYVQGFNLFDGLSSECYKAVLKLY